MNRSSISGHQRRYQRESAFTLIEMMIVIVVIAILLGVLLPQFRGTQDEARMQRARAELRTIATALESYYIHNSNAFPTEVQTLTRLITATPRVISSVPDDPFESATDSSYQLSSNGLYYVVYSTGPDSTEAITDISTAGAVLCTGTCATSIDDICVTNGNAVGATSGNC